MPLPAMKRHWALAILMHTWVRIGVKGDTFEFHYKQLRKLTREFLI